MVHVAYPSGPSADLRRRRRLSRGLSLAFIGVGVAATLASVLPEPARRDEPAQDPAAVAAPATSRPAEAAARTTVAGTAAWMLDPNPLLGRDGATFARPRPAGIAPAAPSARAEAPARTEAPARLENLARAETRPVQVVAEAPAPLPAAPPFVPLPVPRPPELRPAPAAMTPRLASRQPMLSTRSVFSAATAERSLPERAPAERSLVERLFGGSEERAAPALAYAAPQRDGIDDSPRARLSPAPTPSGGTAIYDISAARVTLPSGEVLEAHSGLGHAQDNPRHVHLRMRGATPPGTYDLTERERLFHGVRAIRLNPVGGSAAIHGRDGILAHTYMLGPSGASNGCVVFRNYDRFLQAFLRGEVRRLVVVAGSKGDGPLPGGSRIGLWDRMTGRTGG
ncbi:tlde1 domain-containing protein [Methylobacterium oxalidis]|uniref:tlde1 domain-containing protein n=1 Tax=Methylobacterium oxalidis TaxID=944322 RepID=UPI003315792E